MSISVYPKESNFDAVIDGETRPIKPFLKWPGGKRWLVKQHAYLFQRTEKRHVEPFLGGGAVYLHVQPKDALLSDLNPDVISIYSAIKESWRAVVELLRMHQSCHSDVYYYKVRELIPRDPIERAARILYLNRTCFNGIYRVNLQGKFNVPKGTKTKVILADDDFEAVAGLLKSATINHCDFEDTLSRCDIGDFVFCDPPYTVRHNKNGFIKYNENLFSWWDQQRLAEALKSAHMRGADILCTNADHESVRNLYDTKLFEIFTVSRFSSISASAESRRHFTELVIRSRRN